MYVYLLETNDGILACQEEKDDPRYHLIGTANTTEELANLLKDEKYMEDYAGEIYQTFREAEE